MTSSSIKTIGVIGTGVIGASWTALFLAKGLKVIATDPAPDAEEKILDYLSKTCPTISNGVNISENFLFVRDIIPYLQDVDMIQEVSEAKDPVSKVLSMEFAKPNPSRMDPRG